MSTPAEDFIAALRAQLAARRRGYISCIAYREDGTICRAPATRLAHQRHCMVCGTHAPAGPLAGPAPREAPRP